MGQPTFETPCTTLAPTTPADLEPLWEIWRDPDVRRYRMLTRVGFVPEGEFPGPHYRLRTYRLARSDWHR